MTDITELAQSHELLIANGNEIANLLRHLADNEIDSDCFAVVSECESYGRETEAELSITDFALRAACYVDELVEALEKSDSRLHEVAVACATAEQALEKAQQLATQQGNIACALFDEVTAQRQRISELEESHAQVIQSRDHYKRISEEGLKQLAESRTVTVKLPSERFLYGDSDYDDGFVNGWNARMAEDTAALDRVGIKWEGE